MSDKRKDQAWDSGYADGRRGDPPVPEQSPYPADYHRGYAEGCLDNALTDDPYDE